jgi:2-phosphosulfolactate phosphatase
MIIRLDAYITPYFPEVENQFNDSIAVFIDVLRAGTTVCAALDAGAKEIIPCETIDKAVQIYNNLIKETCFLGGEKNGKKINGFDAGNSPTEYNEQTVKGKTVVICTTNGTKTFLKAKQAKHRIIGSFVNIDAACEYLKQKIDTYTEDVTINFFCSGNNGRLSFEDLLCAGAYIDFLKKRCLDVVMTDAAQVAKNLYNLHSVELKSFIKTREHALYLESIGYSEDIDLALTFNKFPVVPIITGSSIRSEK